MKFLIIGTGQLGKEFIKILSKENKDFIALSHKDLDISDISKAFTIIGNIKPDIIINCSAYNLVDKAEKDYFEAYKTNSFGVLYLANLASHFKSFFVHFSTDYVFDGTKEGLYTEEDAPNPLNEYGKSKYLGELYSKEQTQNFLIFRVSWVYGEGKQNFINKLLEWSKNEDPLRVSYDEISIPTSASLIAHITLKALEKEIKGLFHLTNKGACSRYELAKFTFESLKIKKFIYPVSSDIFNLPAKRPKFSAMDSSKIENILNIEMPHWQDSLKEFLKTIT